MCLSPTGKSVQTEVVAVVGVVIVLAVTAVMAYVLICHRGKIKRWLRPPYEMPEVSTPIVHPHMHTPTHKVKAVRVRQEGSTLKI